MLVYCTTVTMGSENTVTEILDIIAGWLTRKAHEDVNSSSLKVNGSRRTIDNSRITTAVSDNRYPFLFAVRFSHADRDVSGR